jgi:predicted Fe-S protein YdhL (DUF1289 family)
MIEHLHNILMPVNQQHTHHTPTSIHLAGSPGARPRKDRVDQGRKHGFRKGKVNNWPLTSKKRMATKYGPSSRVGLQVGSAVGSDMIMSQGSAWWARGGSGTRHVHSRYELTHASPITGLSPECRSPSEVVFSSFLGCARQKQKVASWQTLDDGAHAVISRQPRLLCGSHVVGQECGSWRRQW